MNIIIFSTIYPAPDKYGIPSDTKVIHYYAKQWKNFGYNVQVVYLHLIPAKKILSLDNIKKLNGFETDYEYDGINVHMIEYQLLVPRANNLIAIQAQNADMKIRRFINKRFIPQKVFVHFPCTFYGINCLTDQECPTMAVLHNVDLSLLQTRRNNEFIFMLNKYRNIGGRNKHICESMSSLLSRKCYPVLSGIDETLIPKEDLIKEKLTKRSDYIRIVYAGNLIPLKNVDKIIKALRLVQFDYQCEIIGDGPEKKHLETLAQGYPNIIFRGRLSRETTIEKMRESDVFVMVSSPETFGLVYIEAMAQGCITIGSKNEGIDGVLINGENGFLVEPGDTEKLKNCLENVFQMSQEEKAAMVHSAYNRALEMTDKNMAIKYFDLNQ